MEYKYQLGLSTSAFIRVMTLELFAKAHPSFEGKPPMRLDEENDRKIDAYVKNIIDAINAEPIIEYVELYHSVCWDNDKVIKAYADNAKFNFWSVHSAYGKYADPSSPVKEIRKLALEAYKIAAYTARTLGAKVMVVHPGANSEYDLPRKERVNLVVDLLKYAADYAGDAGLRMAVEPLPKAVEIGNNLDEVMEIVDRISCEHVGVNFDVNHLFPPENVPKLIRQAGKRIENIHISDQDGQERHWMPMDGTLDWEEVLKAISDIEYKNPLIYETHPRECKTYRDVTQTVGDNFKKLMEILLKRHKMY